MCNCVNQREGSDFRTWKALAGSASSLGNLGCSAVAHTVSHRAVRTGQTVKVACECADVALPLQREEGTAWHVGCPCCAHMLNACIPYMHSLARLVESLHAPHTYEYALP